MWVSCTYSREFVSLVYRSCLGEKPFMICAQPVVRRFRFLFWYVTYVRVRWKYKSAYAISGRHSVPGGDWIIAVPQDDITKTTQCPLEQSTWIEDDANDAREQQSTKKSAMMNTVVVGSLWMQQRCNFMMITCSRSESWCCLHVLAECYRPQRRFDAVFSYIIINYSAYC